MQYAPRNAVISGLEQSGSQAPRLLQQVRDQLRLRHYSLRTEQAYLGWVRRFILANGRRHPRELGAIHLERFLTHLAVEGGVLAPVCVLDGSGLSCSVFSG